jgi:NADPH:quinone reductase-like Zn-dependent oxidoreductase
VTTATAGSRPRLALDAIAGPATRRLAAALAPGGIVVNYGMLSHAPCEIDANDLVFRDVSVRGFWLTQWFAAAPPAERRRLHDRLCGFVLDGTIAVPVEATYPLAEVKAALAHAARPHRHGKILLLPNGPLDGTGA